MAKAVRELLEKGQEKLAGAGVADARFDSRALLSFVIGVPFSKMPLHLGDEASDEQEEEFGLLLDERAEGTPLQYITGEQEFMGLSFYVDERVLIPRLDTEILAEEALKYIDATGDDRSHRDTFRVLDLCCGSGAIGLSIAKLAGVEVTLADISLGALEVAKINAVELGLSDFVDIRQGDLFGALEEDDRFDLIVSNPPYIKSEVIDTLDTEVKDHEPMLALDGGKDGLDAYRRIIVEAPSYLRRDGMLMMEIGFDQADEIKKLLSGAGFDEIRIKKDLAGLDRVAEAKVK